MSAFPTGREDENQFSTDDFWASILTSWDAGLAADRRTNQLTHSFRRSDSEQDTWSANLSFNPKFGFQDPFRQGEATEGSNRLGSTMGLRDFSTPSFWLTRRQTEVDPCFTLHSSLFVTARQKMWERLTRRQNSMKNPTATHFVAPWVYLSFPR